MANPLDLDAYFKRIHFRAPTPPTLATLSGLLAAHIRRIPFENLDVLLGRPIRLELEALERKLVHERRGGYCFEHATLFAAVLEQLGFRPVAHSARVVLVTPRPAAPRTHMFLTVPLDEGTFLVDPGFGGHAPRAPIPFLDGAEVTARGETHRLARGGGEWTLKIKTGQDFADLWMSTAEPENPIDFELGNHWVATHPSSAFVNRLMMRAFTDDGRVSVMNREVTIEHHGELRRSQLADRHALRKLLIDDFGFDLPEVERLRVPMLPDWE